MINEKKQEKSFRQTESCNYLQQTFCCHPNIFTPRKIRPTNATAKQDLIGTIENIGTNTSIIYIFQILHG